VLGGKFLQDSVTGNTLPTLPVVSLANAPEAFQDVLLDLSGSVTLDGADNQVFIDEIAPEPVKAPDNPLELLPYTPLLRYPGTTDVQDGVVAMAHRDQPTLERPGTTYKGRSVYTTFGLEGVNTVAGATTRAQLVRMLIDWAQDEPAVTIVNQSSADSPVGLSVFQANLSSNIAGTTGVTYRWDFGDGTGFQGPYTSNMASHTYATTDEAHTVRVVVTDSWGNKAIGILQVGHKTFLPFVAR
jgi:hypothetical protein